MNNPGLMGINKGPNQFHQCYNFKSLMKYASYKSIINIGRYGCLMRHYSSEWGVIYWLDEEAPKLGKAGMPVSKTIRFLAITFLMMLSLANM